MKNAFFTLGLLFVSVLADAQLQKTVLVEHFTNTRCGICASRNPGLITNFKNNPDILHVSFNPSSPYSTCVLN